MSAGVTNDDPNNPLRSVTQSQLAAAIAPIIDPLGILSNRVLLLDGFLRAMGASWQGWKAGWDSFNSFARLNPWYAACEKLWQQQTDTQFIQWVKSEGLDKSDEDGTSVAGRVYSYSKRAMQNSLEATPEPMRSFIKDQLMHNPDIQRAMRDDDMAAQFERIGTLLRDAFPGDHGLLFDEKYNHKFLTEDSTGNIVAVSEDEVVKLFPQGGENDGKHQRFPHIIITSSHAQGETLKDVTSITHGIEAMARESEGKPMNIGFIDKGVKPGQTLILYACDVRENPWLNAASLLRRINELKRIEEINKDRKKRGEEEFIETEFRYMSPGAKRIAKLMQKCMVCDPSKIDTNDARRIDDIASDTNEGPIILRPGVEEVAHAFQLDGYSKGGNVVRDAARFSVAELTAVRDNDIQVFKKHPESTRGDPNDRTMSERNVRNIMRNIPVMSKAAVDVGMSDYYKRHGVRCVSINNQHDLISAHDNYQSTVYDERWIIKGVEHNVGHDPRHMMGMRDLIEDYDSIRGYVHDDPRVARRLKEYYATNYDKAAIGHLQFDRAAEGEITIEAAPGTTDGQIWAFRDEIKKAFVHAGLRGVTFTDNSEDPGIFTMKCNADFTMQPKELNKFRTAFNDLRHNAKGLLITQNIDEEIVEQIQKFKPQPGFIRSTQGGPSYVAAR